MRLVETHDKYWAELSNLNLDYVNIDEAEIRRHERLLQGGVWAEVTLRYDDTFVFKGQNRPFFIERLRPIQLSNRHIDRLSRGAGAASPAMNGSTSCMRSHGLRAHASLLHAAPQAALSAAPPPLRREELQPRSSWGRAAPARASSIQQVSPYCHLVSGGQTTVAQMFVNLSTGAARSGRAVGHGAFDEAAGVRFPDKNGINIMKGYMEDGNFSRGRDIITAEGSVVFVGNIDGDIETILRTSNLFYPMPHGDGHGLLRPHPLLSPGLGVPEDP